MTSQHDRGSRRYTVHEAALLLGLSVDAVRKRAERGRLKKEKAANGTVYILLDADQTPQDTEGARAGRRATSEETATSRDALIESLRDQIDHLRRELDVRNDELRRKDRLLAAALERIPELEASAEPRESSETAAPGRMQDADRADEGREGQEATARRSWFMRFFFGP